jgi:hypothetical protein
VSFRDRERQKAVKYRDAIFRDPGSGIFFGKERDFVLQDPSLNLWDGIREDAKQYFQTNNIAWWQGNADDPTGHLLSSQVACLNHLYFLRQRKDVATALLQRVRPDIAEALVVDSGFVEFEYIGNQQYLKEHSFTRGANCTSLDAIMYGVTSEDKRTLFLIEWKYTEMYSGDDLYIASRAEVYDSLIIHPEGPFVSGIDPKAFYYEPFYQMMRQTLLGWLFEQHHELDCDAYMNIHVIPQENTELTRNITSPLLREQGHDLHEVWTKVLKQSQKYIQIDPSSLLKEFDSIADTKSWLTYLERRYW